MKIPHLPLKTHDAADPAAGADAARRKATPAGAQPVAGSTQVELSPISTLLSGASADVDMDRVQAIRNAIRNGELQIDASRIADGLIDSTRDLLGR